MALALRLRRTLTLSSSILRDLHVSSISSSSPPLSSPKPYSPLIGNPNSRPNSLIQAQSFRSSPIFFNRRFDRDDSNIDPDEILFEGCDYNHWLITIDFPKEDLPSAEKMVETYVQTAANVFGSVEEAKKRIYACSTTTYHGFQCVCDEATSKKFEGLPGVVFILPDSYIDPVNKEYGGDKYENGVITHRPPPVQYGRQGRYNDRNRNYDQPRYNNPPMQQRAPPQDGRGYGPPPQDGSGHRPPPQDGRGYGPPPQDGSGHRRPPQDGRGYGPPPQDGSGHRPPPQDGRGYGPPPQEGRGYGQGERGNYQSGFGQGQQGNIPPQEQRNFSQGPGGNYRQPSLGYNNSDNRQGVGSGYAGDYRQGQGNEPSSNGPIGGQWQTKY